ncbi:acyl-CoA synthetase [Halobium palmae]|uniref:Acyl-CoA synthetase n=1 Tax=Halobium palmae TaxID=1776492 RepID=A0ABD5RX04_9EURY
MRDLLEHTPLLDQYESYEAARSQFSWDPPQSYNVATDLVESQPDPSRPALYHERPDGDVDTYSFADVDAHASRVAGLLADRGVTRGNAVAVCLPKIPETPIAHMAVFKLGAVLVPLSELFGPASIEYRVVDADVDVLVTDESGVEKLTPEARSALDHVVTVGAAGESDEPLLRRVERYPADVTAPDTSWDDSAMLVYTSGTTSDPKGVLHGHRHVASYYPAFEMANGLLSGGERVFWSPSDWAWVGCLVANLYCAWHYGYPYVTRPTAGGFDPAAGVELIERHGVTNAFLVPTALKMLADAEDAIRERDLGQFRNVTAGGEPLPDEVAAWAESTLDVDLVEIYGQTEANMLLTTAPEWFDIERGQIGRPVPGTRIRLVDEDGDEVPPGEPGELALESPHPTMFKEYLNKPEETAARFWDGWLLTGDLLRRDESGVFAFETRKDDLIISSGYRISPAEIEAEIRRHDDVRDVAVTGRPDEQRGQIVAAYVEPTDDADPTELRSEIRTAVREDLAAYEYPRAIELVDHIPTTTTGKVKREDLGE